MRSGRLRISEGMATRSSRSDLLMPLVFVVPVQALPLSLSLSPSTSKHRKRIEEAFGWARTVGGIARGVYRGVERVRSRFILTMAANNLARLPRLLVA